MVAPLIENGFARQVLGPEWLDERSLRVLMAPPDDWQDEAAHENGHVAVVDRVDWTAVPARSLSGRDLAGPRIFAPRPEPREAVQRAVANTAIRRQAQRVEPSGKPVKIPGRHRVGGMRLGQGSSLGTQLEESRQALFTDHVRYCSPGLQEAHQRARSPSGRAPSWGPRPSSAPSWSGRTRREVAPRRVRDVRPVRWRADGAGTR